MGNNHIKGIIEPCLYSCDNIIKAVNKEFIYFTEFTMDELLGKTLIEVGDMLRINSQISLNNMTSNKIVYMFTRFFEAREVSISFFEEKETNQKVHVFTEKSNSRLKDKLIFVEQTFLDNRSNVAVYSIPELILLKSNQRYRDFLDPPFNKEENTVGRHVGEIVKGFVGSESEVSWKVVIETQKFSHVKNLKFETVDGNVTYWDSSKTPIFENGIMKYMFITSVDVTERVLKNQIIEGQNKIIQQKKELEAIIENIYDGISIFDNKGQYILSNKSSRKMFSVYDEDIDQIGDKGKKKVGLENIPANRVLNGEGFKNMKITVKVPHKTLQINVSGTPIYDNEGKLTAGVLCSRDMTNYFKNEEVIRSQYEFLNRIVDTFNLPVIRLSCHDLKIVDINKKAFSIVKLLRSNIKSVKQIKGNTVESLFKTFKTSEYYKCIDQVLKEKKAKELNKKSILINGKNLYWNIMFEPVFQVNREVKEILILIIDVTAEIKSNMDMERTLKLQEEFLANISHEFKTPLNVISSTVQLIDMYCSNDSLDEKKSSIIRYIESIKQNSYRLSKLVNNIVDISKIQAGFFELNLSNNNIVELIEEMVMYVSDFTKSKGLNIIFDTNTEEKIIACDTEKIERLILNLISNAIKFSDKGGEIFVDVKEKSEFIEISVSDNGIGIEEKNLDMIFDRFKQVNKSLSRNAEGTGIGLSLVKSIAELHGGSIYVESEFGKGSKFTIFLPNRKVEQENKLLSNNIRSKNESVKIEFSDVCY